jgi:hypothetical protein
MSNVDKIKFIILALDHKKDKTQSEEKYLNLFKENKYKIDSTLFTEINYAARKNKDKTMQDISAKANVEILQPLIKRGTKLYEKDKDARLFVESSQSPQYSPVMSNVLNGLPQKKSLFSRTRSLLSRVIKRRGGKKTKTRRNKKDQVKEIPKIR